MIVLGTCTRLRARITERQCKINQGIPELPCRGCTGLESLQQQEYSPLITTDDTDNTSDASAPKKEKTMAYKGTCKYCGRENIRLQSATKCSRCYYRLSKGLDPVTGKPASVACDDTVELLSIQKPDDEFINNEQSTLNYEINSAPPQESVLDPSHGKTSIKREPRKYPTPETITLEFYSTRDADLYGKLQCLAVTHRRTLEAEIMFQLEERIGAIEETYMAAVYGDISLLLQETR